MTKRFFILTAVCLLALSSSVTAQRRVDVSIEGLFAFDPLTGYYCKESLPSVATYIEAWRQESEVLLYIDNRLSWGYRHYCSEVDTTLLLRVSEYLGGEILPRVDSSYLRDISDFPQSRAFNAHFASDIEAIKRYFATPIHRFDSVLSYNPYGDSDFESLFHTFQCDITGADISLFSPPSLTAILPSELYIRQLVELLYFDNELVVVQLSGRQLRDILERSYSTRYYTVKSSSDDLLRINSSHYYHISISDTPHTVNLAKKRGNRVENWKLEADKLYLVALNSFLAKDFEVLRNFGDYKDLIIEWLKVNNNRFSRRILADLQPKRVVDKIIERESLSIFGSE